MLGISRVSTHFIHMKHCILSFTLYFDVEILKGRRIMGNRPQGALLFWCCLLLQTSYPFILCHLCRKKKARGGHPGGKREHRNDQYHCDYCQKDLSTSLRIKCNECDDFDLCLECFSVGVEITPHKNTHAYRVVDSLSFPVYTMDWGADEETLLLEGVEHFGLGNWTQIASHVGRSAADCREHYYKVYIDNDCFPQPRKVDELPIEHIRSMIEEKRRAGARRIAAAKSGITYEDEDPYQKAVKVEEKPEETESGKMDGHSNGTVGTKTLHSPAVTTQQQGAPLALAESQQSGYHIKRNEFEVEYDHEAENLISEMEFGEDDTEEQVKDKLRLIEIYNKRLDERERRKEFVLSRGLVKVKRQQLIDRRRSAHEKEVIGKMRVFARYMPHPQWEALSDGLMVEGRLRARIQELKQYRAMGMRTFEEVDNFLETSGPPKKESSINNQPGRSKLQRILIDTYALEGEMGKMGNLYASNMIHGQHNLMPDGKGVNGMQTWRTKRGILLDVTSLPDTGPLTHDERNLCASERYLPAQYLAVKAEIMKKQEQNGFVTRNDILSQPFAVDEERSLRLLDFFSRKHWIKLKR